MSATDPCHREKITVWVKATSVANKAKLHHWCGRLAKSMWLRGIVKKGFFEESAKEKKNETCPCRLPLWWWKCPQRSGNQHFPIQAAPPCNADKPNNLTTLVNDGGFLCKSVSDTEDNNLVAVGPMVEACCNATLTHQKMLSAGQEDDIVDEDTPEATTACALRMCHAMLAPEKSVLPNLAWPNGMA